MASGKKTCARKSRTRSADRVRQIAASIRRSGFTGPVLFAPATPVLPGQDRVPTARETGMDPLPCIPLADLPDASSLRFRSGRPARRSGPVCGFMQGWSAGRQAGRGVTGRSAMSGLHRRS